MPLVSRDRTLILTAAAAALLIILATALVMIGLRDQKERYALTDSQIEALGLTHWSSMERWAFARMRETPGGEVVFADYAGEGLRSVSPRFLSDVLTLGTGLDGSGPLGLNFKGAAIRGDLDLQGRELDFLRLVGTTIGGKLAMAGAVVRAVPDLEGSGDIWFKDVSVSGIADFANVRAEAMTITGLEGADFVLFSGADVGSLKIAESYGFDLVAILQARVAQDFIMQDVALASDLVLQGLSARSLSLDRLAIGGQLDGVGMVVDGAVRLSHIRVGQELILSSSTFGGDLIADESVTARSALTDAMVGGVSRLAIQRHTD